jgi:hypothetical protein
LWEQVFSRFELKIILQKKNSNRSEFAFFKRRRWKEMKEDPNSMANGRLHCLVALERFHYLVANGRRKRNTFSPFSHFPTFPPINFI